jgi:hypothetical protein
MTDRSTAPAAPSPGAERMRRHRERRRNGLRSVTVELRDSEVNELIKRGYLAPESRADKDAIRTALYWFLDHDLRGT